MDNKNISNIPEKPVKIFWAKVIKSRPPVAIPIIPDRIIPLVKTKNTFIPAIAEMSTNK